MTRTLTLIVSLLVGCSALFAQGNGTPRIVSTSPKAFTQDVDPALDKITVTFDRAMTDGSWSWTGGGESYPQTTARPSYDDAKTTCTLPVKLEPGKVYRVGINSPSHQNFKSADGQPAGWYMILFATRSADGKPTPLPADMAQSARQLNSRHPPVRAAATRRSAPEAPAAPAEADAAEANEDPAVQAGLTWLAHVDAKQYQEMWDGLDPMAQKMVNQATFTAQVSGVRDAIGALAKRELASAEAKDSLPGAPDGKYMILTFDSSFQKKKQATETMVMQEVDGSWKVSGYFVK